MARGYVQLCPVSSVKRSLLVTFAILFTIQGVWSQRVRVEEEQEAYPSEHVDLRCQFVDGGGKTKLTQVSWIWEPVEGQRDNIAVFHPIYGESFPDLAFKDRVKFIQGTLENPSIRISNLRMSDAGRYTCEYATYPSGNEQGTTTLVMLAKPKNSARVMTVQAGSKAVVVARCEAADGKPAAEIDWLGSVSGNHSRSEKPGADGTVTVTSEYQLVPTAGDHGRTLTCRVRQRTQSQPETFPMKLSVEYSPYVSIDGYDHNWFKGRSDAWLLCQANANPAPTTVTWTAVSGPMPDTVVVDKYKLTVRKVDEAVNTTFVCEVKNRLGSGKHEVTTIVIEERKKVTGPATGAIIGGILGALLLIGVIIAVVLLVRKRQQDADGPPKHKPPPPVKTGSSTEMLTKPPTATETAPLSGGEVYYEPTGGEPITNLDDEANMGGGTLNGGAPPVLEDTAPYEDEHDDAPDQPLTEDHRGNDPEVANHEPLPPANISRGESFVSAAMYV